MDDLERKDGLIYPNELEYDNRIRIDSEDVSDTWFRVSDVREEDLRLTTIVAVSLLSKDMKRYAIEWATHSRTASLVELDGDGEWEIEVSDIELQF